MKWSISIVLIVLGISAAVAVSASLWRRADAPTAVPVVPEESPVQDVVLDQKKQEQIWELEHITFEIETHFGKAFSNTLAERAQHRLRPYFLESFRGAVFAARDVETRRVGIVSEVRRPAAEAPVEQIDADQLVERLVGALSDFDVVDRVRLRVLKIAESAEAEGTWQAHILLTAHGVGREGELLVWESEHDVTFQFEEQRELQEGPTVAVWQWKTENTRRSDHALMQEFTSQAGLDRIDLPDNWQLPANRQIARSFQMAVEDFDRDGFLDIAIATTGSRRPLLLQSIDGGHFEDRAGQLGLHGWRADTSLVGWIDYDNDGYPDLLMGDRLYRNMAGQRFVDVTQVSGLTFDFEPTGFTVVDYDADGRLDLYVLYEIPRSQLTERAGDKRKPWVGDEQSGALNRLWHNEGGGKFRDVTYTARAAGGRRQTFAASWMFFDDDHLPDVYVANDFGENVLLRNQGDGTFVDATEAAGCGDFATSMGVTSGDIDNDGRCEIYVANMYSKMGRRILANVGATDYPAGMYEQLLGSCAGNRLYTRAPGESHFRETSADLGINGVGWAFAPAMSDFDGDGWLDVYASTGFRSFDRTKPDG